MEDLRTKGSCQVQVVQDADGYFNKLKYFEHLDCNGEGKDDTTDKAY